jgi:16S rRNA processing protein RimM
MDKKSCFKVGYILKPHGLKGEVTISLESDAPDNMEELGSIFIDENERLVPYFMESISLKGNKAFVKFEDVDSIDDAEKISKSGLYLPKSERPESQKGEFYDDEIIGFSVSDKTAGELGLVQEVIHAGPNRLIVTLREDKEVMIPVNGPFILSINKSKKHIRVDLPEGFLEI